MSKSMEQELSLKEKASLNAHLAICKTCCFCFKQLKSLRQTLTHYAEAVFRAPAPGNPGLSDDAKQRIKEKLKSS